MDVNGKKNVVWLWPPHERSSIVWLVNESLFCVTFFYESLDPGQKSSLEVFTNCKKFSRFFLLWSIKESLTGMEWHKLIILMENAVIPWKILSSLHCQQCSLPVSSSPWPWDGIVGIKYYVGNSATFWWSVQK